MPEIVKYRPVHWSDLSKPDAPIVGWGIERKLPSDRRYKPVGYKGQVHPFASKAESFDWLVWLAPKVWLIKEIAGLIK